jgi:GAF domain-containing protein
MTHTNAFISAVANKAYDEVYDAAIEAATERYQADLTAISYNYEQAFVAAREAAEAASGKVKYASYSTFLRPRDPRHFRYSH